MLARLISITDGGGEEWVQLTVEDASANGEWLRMIKEYANCPEMAAMLNELRIPICCHCWLPIEI